MGSLTAKEANRVIQESRKSNQNIIKKALSKIVNKNTRVVSQPVSTGRNTRKIHQLSNTTNSANTQPVSTGTNTRKTHQHPLPVSTSTNTNTRKSNQVTKTSSRKKHWLVALLEYT